MMDPNEIARIQSGPGPFDPPPAAADYRHVVLTGQQHAWLLALVERENRRNLDSGMAVGLAAIKSGEAGIAHKVRTELRQAQPWSNDDPWDDEDIVDFHNSLLTAAPDEWDGDEDQSHIIERWVEHLVEEVKAKGGCLKPFCGHNEGDPCDHGFLPEPALHWCDPGCNHPPLDHRHSGRFDGS